MCRWKASIIVALLLAAQCAEADDFDYYWPWIKANITNSSLIAGNAATNIYLLAPGATGYVSKISAHVYGISIPTNTMYGSNAWAWVQANSNRVTWTSNAVVSLSNAFYALPTNSWNNTVVIAAWASNNVVGISNLVYSLPTNDWNWSTNLAISISNFLGTATGAWNTAISGGSNVALWASNNVTSISNFLYSVTNDWNWSTNLAISISNFLYDATNSWNMAVTNISIYEDTTNWISQTGQWIYIGIRTNYAGGSTDTSELTNMVTWASNGVSNLSNFLSSATGLWNTVSVVSNDASWASNNVLSVSNFLGTATGLWNTVGSVSQQVAGITVSTGLWNTVGIVSNDATFASNHVIGISNALYALPTNDWNWSTNLAISISNFLYTATNEWNKAFTNVSWTLADSNSFSFTGQTLYIEFKTNYDSTAVDTEWLTNMVTWASNNTVGTSNLLEGISNIVVNLPTNLWNTVEAVSQQVAGITVSTGLWNTVSAVSNDATWASNTVNNISNTLAGATNNWNWTTNLAIANSNQLNNLPTNDWITTAMTSGLGVAYAERANRAWFLQGYTNEGLGTGWRFYPPLNGAETANTGDVMVLRSIETSGDLQYDLIPRFVATNSLGVAYAATAGNADTATAISEACSNALMATAGSLIFNATTNSMWASNNVSSISNLLASTGGTNRWNNTLTNITVYEDTTNWIATTNGWIYLGIRTNYAGGSGGDVYLAGTNNFTGPSNSFSGTTYAPTGAFDRLLVSTNTPYLNEYITLGTNTGMNYGIRFGASQVIYKHSDNYIGIYPAVYSSVGIFYSYVSTPAYYGYWDSDHISRLFHLDTRRFLWYDSTGHLLMSLTNNSNFGQLELGNLILTNLLVVAGTNIGDTVTILSNKVFGGTMSVLTNIVSTGSGTSLVYGVAGTVGTNKSIAAGSNVSIADDGSTITISSTGSGTSSGPATNLTYNGTSTPDYSSYFAGYPIIPLTTNMMTLASTGGTLPTMASMVRTIDHDFNTTSTTGTTGSVFYHVIGITLPTTYSGYAVVVAQTKAVTTVGFFGLGYGQNTDFSAISDEGSMYLASNQGNADLSARNTSFVTNTFIKYFNGNRIVFSAYAHSSQSAGYTINEIMVFGVTNGFNTYTNVFH